MDYFGQLLLTVGIYTDCGKLLLGVATDYSLKLALTVVYIG